VGMINAEDEVLVRAVQKPVKLEGGEDAVL
jgi:hypothetical protein